MTDSDAYFMRLAIAQAAQSIKNGELPFGSVVVNKAGQLIGAGAQHTKLQMTDHAEIMAMLQATPRYGDRLRDCTLYSTVEPCAMCSFIARQYEVSRVVFGLRSPLMGGVSHWQILADRQLNRSELGFLDLAFSAPPEIIGGCCEAEIWSQWYGWNFVAAAALELGGIFVGEVKSDYAKRQGKDAP